MSKFVVVNLKPMSGLAKASQRPYNMLIVSGIFTNDDGTMEVGEVVFMESLPMRPLPSHLVAGQTYTPTLGASARDGKLSFQIIDLKPVAVAPVKQAA